MGSLDDRDRRGAEVDATSNSVVLDALVHRAIDRGGRWLLSRQDGRGFWSGEVRQTPALEADYILFQTWLGQGDTVTVRGCGEQLLRDQRPDGGWGLDSSQPLHLSATVKSYFALKLLGHAPTSEPLVRAREAIRRGGGVREADSLTRYWLALLGQLPFSQCDALAVELLFGPKCLPTHVHYWGARARPILVPLSIVWAWQPVRAVPSDRGIVELFADAPSAIPPADAWLQSERPTSVGRRLPRNVLAVLGDRAIKLAERLRLCWLRGLALRSATEWILAHLVGSDGLGASFQGIAWSWLALHCQGFHERTPELRFCQEQLDALLVRQDGVCRVQPLRAPVRDTAFALQALAATGVPGDESRITLAVDWLLEKEVTRRGDGAAASAVEPSGWSREFYNEFCPDAESTAAVLRALAGQLGSASRETPESLFCVDNGEGDGLELTRSVARRLGVAVGPAADTLTMLSYARFTEVRQALRFTADWSHLSRALRRGQDWLIAQQNRDGGWGWCDRDLNIPWLRALPWADTLPVGDSSDPHVTGQVLRLLGDCEKSCDDIEVRRAVEFLGSCQRRDGAWWNSLGAAPVATTAAVLAGLKAIGLSVDHPLVSAGLDWLLSRQQPCGGWCEVSSATPGVCDETLVPLEPPTPTGTAGALLALVDFLGCRHPALRRAASWLVDRQLRDGSWEDLSPTDRSCGRDSGLRYALHPHCLTLLALAHWLRSR